jgi:hypothetical protein
MRLPEAARSAADAAGPVWTRAKKKRGNPFFRFLVGLLALIALLVLVLAGVDRSFAKAGGRIDGWICAVVHQVTGAKAKAAAMDQTTPVEPASAPAAPPATLKPQAAPAAATAPAAKP